MAIDGEPSTATKGTEVPATRDGQPPGRTASPTRVPLFSVLAANAVSQVGDMMVAVAMPWFVLQTTGSVVQMGLAGAVVGLGALLASVAGGPLIDMTGLRRASVASDLMAGLAVAAIPVLYWADLLPFGVFLLLLLVIAILNAPGDLARRALMPTLARWASMPLERANSLDTGIPRLAQLAGPVLGGVLVVVAGAAEVLLLNAMTFLFSAAVVWLGVPRRADAHAEATEPAADVRDHQVFGDPRLARNPVRQYLDELREGIRFVRRSGLLVSLIAIAMVANILEKPLMSVVAPVYAEEQYGSAASFGSLLGAFGAGALLGTIGFGVVGHRLPRRRTFVACLLLAPLVMFGSLAMTPPLPLLLVLVAAAGVLFGPMNTLMATAVQESTPPELLGRVFGTVSALSMIGIPLGAAVVGVVVSAAGMLPTIVLMGAVYLVTGVVMAFNPALRPMDREAGATVGATDAR